MKINKKIAWLMAMLAVMTTSVSADLSVDEVIVDTTALEVLVDNTAVEVVVDTTDTGWVLDYLASFLVPAAEASNPMATMVGNTSSWSIAAAGDIMATPFWSIVYFIIGIALLSVAIWVIFWISRKG